MKEFLHLIKYRLHFHKLFKIFSAKFSSFLKNSLENENIPRRFLSHLKKWAARVLSNIKNIKYQIFDKNTAARFLNTT